MVQVLGYITLGTIFGSGKNAKETKVRYMVVNAPLPYNIIIGRLDFNSLGAVFSTLYLTMKFPLEDGEVVIVKGNQERSRQCYRDSLQL